MGDMKTFFAVGIIDWNQVRMNEASGDEMNEASTMELQARGKDRNL